MTELFLNNQRVVLSADTTIGITALNPYFNEMEAFSYPFTIPYKPNEHILNYAARIQSIARTYVWDAVLIVDGVTILRGEAIAEGDLEDGAFPLILRSGKTSFVKRAETKKMQELDFGVENTDGMSTNDVLVMRSATLQAPYPYHNYVCAPFYNNKAWTEKESTWLIPDYMNGFDPYSGLLIGILNDGSNKGNTITYSFYVRYILKRIIELFGYTPGTDAMSTIPDLNRWFLLALNNAWGTFHTEYKYSFSQKNVRDFLKVLRQFGIVLIINDKLNTASIQFVRDVINTQRISHLLNDHALKDVPVMNTPMDGYTVSYNDSTSDLIVSPVKKSFDVLSSIPKILVTVAHYSEIPTPTSLTMSYLYFVTTTERYYSTILQDKETDTDPDVYKWENVANYEPLVTGEGEEKYSIDATVVGQREEKWTITKTMVVGGGPSGPVSITKIWDIDIEMPEINQKMNNFYNLWYEGSKYEDPPFAFLFNWGVKAYPNSEDARFEAYYPVISGDAYGFDEAAKGTIGMRTYGERSIITQLVKDEADWKIRRKTKRQYFELSILDYANFDWSEIQNIASTNYLVNSLIFDISTKGISLIEAELFTV